MTLCGENGEPAERYLYDPYGLPSFFDGSWSTRGGSVYGNAVLFTGRLWHPGTYTYDYRHREHSPYLGRFLQRDPLGAWGDSANAGNAYGFTQMPLGEARPEEPPRTIEPPPLPPPTPPKTDLCLCGKDAAEEQWQCPKSGRWYVYPGNPRGTLRDLMEALYRRGPCNINDIIDAHEDKHECHKGDCSDVPTFLPPHPVGRYLCRPVCACVVRVGNAVERNSFWWGKYYEVDLEDLRCRCQCRCKFVYYGAAPYDFIGWAGDVAGCMEAVLTGKPAAIAAGCAGLLKRLLEVL